MERSRHGAWRGSPAILSALVLAASGVVTSYSWREAHAEAASDLRAEFDFQVRDAEIRVKQRMAAYEQLLRGVEGLFVASGSVEPLEFRAYVENLRLDRSYPGIQGVGFGRLVAAADVARFTAAIRGSRLPDYAVFPAGAREAYAPVVYLEPATGRNRRAFGYDMLSEPVRREALERARDTGEAVLTGKLRLVYDQATEAGAILYLPVYRPGSRPATVAERRAALQGWIYAAFRMADLMRGIHGEASPGLDIELFDGAVPAASSLLYDRDDVLHARDAAARFRAERALEIAGRRWTMLVHSDLVFEARQDTGKQRAVAVVGGAVGALTALLVWVLARSRLTALRHAHELARREDALRRSEKFFRAVLRSSTEFWCLLDREGRYLQVGPSAPAVVGWSEEELRAAPAFVHVHPDDRAKLQDVFRAVVAEPGGTAHLAYRFRHKDGSWRVLDTDARNLLADPDVRSVVVNRRDVTAQRRLEEQLQQAQKLESIGRLAGGVAHDFNNILTVIMSCGAEIEEDLAAGAPVRPESVHEIRASSERARDLTRQLLAFARKQIIEPVPLDLSRVVRGSEKLLRRILGEDVRLAVDLADGLWATRCDVGQVEQLILNLAVNARDAMPQGGTLFIETRNVTRAVDDEIAAGDYVRLTLRDTGTGMTPEVKAHLFEPFFTTKPQGHGTGLGLATVYGIVKQSGGHVLVDSEPGQGTGFEILLPRTHEPAQSAAGEVRAPARRGDETILVVEDEPLVRRVTVRALEAAGYTVLVAASGEEALALEPEALARVRLLVTDVVMPGMNGRALAERLLARHPRLSVLYVSGYTRDAIAQRGVLDDGIEFLSKPFTGPVLLARVRVLLDREPAAA